MKRLFEQNFLIRKNLLFILGVCLCLYFVYHTLQGERSVTYLMALNQKIEQKAERYAALKTERESIEQKVVMLRPSSLNIDFLEERARIVLGYGVSGETVIVQN